MTDIIKKIELPHEQSICKLHEWPIYSDINSSDQLNNIVDSFKNL